MTNPVLDVVSKNKEKDHISHDMQDVGVQKLCGNQCKEIQKKIFGRSFNLRDDEEKQLFREAGAHKDDDKCCAVVGDGARWATEIMLKEIEKRSLKPEDFKDLIYPK